MENFEAEGNTAKNIFQKPDPGYGTGPVMRSITLPPAKTNVSKKNLIFYLEDERVNHILGKNTLDKAFNPFFKTIVASTYKQALQMLEKNINEIAIACLDYDLRDDNGDGGDIATLIGLANPQIPKICISNSPDKFLISQRERNLFDHITTHKYGNPLIKILNPYLINQFSKNN